MLITTDLSALAPVLPQGDSETGPFEDYALDPLLPLSLTGRQYDRVVLCDDPRMGQCFHTLVYRHYRALTEAWLSFPLLHVVGQVSAAPAIAAPVRIERELLGSTWTVAEPIIPPDSP